MIIGFDITPIQYGTGVSYCLYHLVKNLLKIDKTNQYKLFFSSLRQSPPQFTPQPNLKIYHYRLPARLTNQLLNLLPIELFIGKCDIFHASDMSHPAVIKTKLVTTIYDLVAFLFPQWSDPQIISAHQIKMRRALKKCSHFVCISQSTRKDLLKTFPIPAPKTSVIYPAVEKKYQRQPPPKLIKQIKQKYGLNKFFLVQGTREPRKNLPRIIKSFQQANLSGFQLAITGKYGWGLPVRLQNCRQNENIKILGYLPEADLWPLHAAAFALLYPSLYEGFGLPIVKSMALGIPVITSNCSSTKEIAGSAALLVNPKSTKSITTAISQLTNNPKLYQKLARLGPSRAAKFSWSISVRQHLKLYNQINNQ